MPSIFRADSREISNPKEIANLFCKYFTNIGPNLASKIPVSEKSHNFFFAPKTSQFNISIIVILSDFTSIWEAQA